MLSYIPILFLPLSLCSYNYMSCHMFIRHFLKDIYETNNFNLLWIRKLENRIIECICFQLFFFHTVGLHLLCVLHPLCWQKYFTKYNLEFTFLVFVRLHRFKNKKILNQISIYQQSLFEFTTLQISWVPYRSIKAKTLGKEPWHLHLEWTSGIKPLVAYRLHLETQFIWVHGQDVLTWRVFLHVLKCNCSMGWVIQ